MTTDEGKMSFLEHLGELRTRIVWSLIPTAVGLIVAFRFSDRILQFIRRPLDRANVQLVSLTPTEGFWTSMKISMVMGVILAMPVILWQVWAFIAPGLHKHERRFAGPFVIIGPRAGDRFGRLRRSVGRSRSVGRRGRPGGW